MKILLTGCQGQLGIELSRQLSRIEARHHLLQTDIPVLDITDSKQVSLFIVQEKPDVVINCAAYTNVDKCESDEYNAFKVNAIGAQNLAIATFNIGAKIVHISTDYVFDGTDERPKREYDLVKPLNVYGKSKAYGERLVRVSNPRHFILRTAWLYGKGNNFVRTMLKLSKEKRVVDVVGDQYGTPTSTADLAQCIINLIETEHYGTFHATCEGACSWYEFARKIFIIKNIDIEVNKITTDQLPRPAARPKYSVLENFMLNLFGMNNFRNWQVALEEYLTKEEV